MKNVLKKLFVSFAICLLAAISVNVTNVEAATKKFNVTFIYGNNVNVQQVKQGKNAVVPTDTDVAGYVFAGWTDTAANIQCDKTILGMYTPTAQPAKKLTGWQTPLKVNDDLSAPGEPWWDYSLKGVPGQTCVVRWYNGSNGELWKTEVVPYGTTLDDPENPCIAGLDFVGWVGSWENITEDRNIMAWYYHKNKVEFVDDEGKVQDTQWVRDGEDADPPRELREEGYDYDKGDLENINSNTKVDVHKD